ncbi:branched-chain amino acid ABC transporter permease [Allopusillimonas ginsengisoli]|uniref:branched-chain amino acid ABC transporter permease n=1 Tax=Allopusillimonas ginsengisoli TaxID=453575 RepID=UPI0010209328|nr:branched-chain amino acid ABC transporter permease [Allopusillimonas ginsengisoli]TEA77233.1 branched-chain amino acid ABC transporter permease [Allopusillimonas ginsengisoli]
MTDRFMRNGLLSLLVVVLASTFFTSGYAGNLLIWVAIAAALASSLRFVLLIGELNFSVAAFFGLGAYTAGVMTTIWELPFWLALLASGAMALVVSIVFGYITLRVKGPYFLLIGFAFTEAMRILYTRSDWLGGNSGMVGIFPPEILYERFPAFVVLMAGLMVFVLAWIERSYLGRIFNAIRDNDNVVRSVGIPVHLIKVLCFSIASFMTGVAGALQAFSNNVISPLDFGFLLSTFALAYLKVGGEGHPGGPVLGAVVLVLLASVAQGFGGAEHIFYGAAILISVLFIPDGLMGLVSRLRTGRGKAAAMSAGETR